MSSHQASTSQLGSFELPDESPVDVQPERRFLSKTLRAVSNFTSNRKALVGGILLLAMGALAILAPVISPGDPSAIVARPRLPPSSEFWFGTTSAGQDVFAQTIWGARVSLTAGLLVGILTTILGALIGMAGGYFGGKVDDTLSLVINVFLIMPSLPLLITLAAFLPTGALTIILVLSITGWAWPARVLRSQTLSLREKDFVAAAQVSGESSPRIIFLEILPNMLSIMAASFIGSVIYGISAQAGLEFIGLGDASIVSWGTNLYWAQVNSSLLTGAWWTFVPSGLCIALVAFGLSLLNYAVDEVTNPRLRTQRSLLAYFKSAGRNMGASRSTPVIHDESEIKR